MIETIWIIVPNLIASYMVMVNKAFYANMIYCFCYLLLIWHNYNSGDSSQMIYFTILEIMSIVGVFLYIYQTGRTVGINVKKKEQQQVAKIR
ncbi:hypothetical protein AOB57_012420 [Methanosarcina flavescens]|jgi:hypothetical protein|uniref:DUF2069 domain-containing protein n=1 Tax=Methanosarcina flavescens TaxID=1715806 RepID=A0A660HUB5_9EURY|nr:hypothetical protein AOB57_012420 [Methanosarcina flavescens]